MFSHRVLIVLASVGFVWCGSNQAETSRVLSALFVDRGSEPRLNADGLGSWFEQRRWVEVGSSTPKPRPRSRPQDVRRVALDSHMITSTEYCLAFGLMTTEEPSRPSGQHGVARHYVEYPLGLVRVLHARRLWQPRPRRWSLDPRVSTSTRTRYAEVPSVEGAFGLRCPSNPSGSPHTSELSSALVYVWPSSVERIRTT